MKHWRRIWNRSNVQTPQEVTQITFELQASLSLEKHAYWK